MHRANWIQITIGTETSLAPLRLCTDRLCEAAEFGRALLVSTGVVTSEFTDTNRKDKRNQSNAAESPQDHDWYKPEAPATMMPRLHVHSHFAMLNSYLKLKGDYKSKSL